MEENTRYVNVDKSRCRVPYKYPRGPKFRMYNVFMSLVSVSYMALT